jgi:hypothetical protein
MASIPGAVGAMAQPSMALPRIPDGRRTRRTYPELHGYVAILGHPKNSVIFPKYSAAAAVTMSVLQQAAVAWR